MRAALFSALVTPLLLVAPGTALADEGDPPPIFTQQEKCAAAKGFADKVRAQQPDATPQQIADVYIAVLDSKGAYRGIEHIREQNRQQMVDDIVSCAV
ncbi:hypothetical protein [Nocardia goodfellowii]|uniref:Hemophore-related protein n=1 Tax=Nocardia goodfellowii TaxID=882446 RepID=A0ABS4Q7J2_9NOCA|nr:hypothetical protein [Nocardia goodfellowii]MBP2187660.1 hypothetical protein [Nocardia goodfellowii]